MTLERYMYHGRGRRSLLLQLPFAQRAPVLTSGAARRTAMSSLSSFVASGSNGSMLEPCPVHWTAVSDWPQPCVSKRRGCSCGAPGAVKVCCKADALYRGTCSVWSAFDGYKDAEKQRWAEKCKAAWRNVTVKVAKAKATGLAPTLAQQCQRHLAGSSSGLPPARPRAAAVATSNHAKLALAMSDRRPFIFVHPRTNRAAVLCFCHKGGSMAWTSLLAKARSKDHDRWTQHKSFIDYPSPNGSLDDSLAYVADRRDALLNDANVPRVRLVRSPYARLLSAFLDKLAFTNATRRFDEWLMHLVKPKGFHAGGSFAAFVEALTKLSPSSREVNDHFKLQHDACRLPNGGSWDYELKIEEMHSWYAPLLALLGLEADACSGWNKKLGQPCFYRLLPHLDCAGSPTASGAGVGTGTQGSLAKRHNTGSDAKLVEYLRNASVAAAITRWVRQDLERFGYVEWNPQL